MTAAAVITVGLAYGIGCLNAGYYLLRWRDGRDIRALGSGNAGARNAGRILGRGAFALVFVIDAAKGVLAVLAARAWAPEMAPLCAVAATLGHVFPAQLGWRGGRGVATALGALAVLDLWVLVAVAAGFGAARLVLRRTVAAGVLGFACGAAFALGFRPASVGLAALTLAGLLGFTHRGAAWRSKAAGTNPTGS